MKENYQQLIDLYIRAKDRHQPYLMTRVFAEDATLKMVVDTEIVAFPSTTMGLDNITDILVKQFHTRFENVHTVCVTESSIVSDDVLRCTWLVGMTDVESGSLRIGYGVYDWTFGHRAVTDKPCVQHLEIHIKTMIDVSAELTQSVLPWFSSLPHTWVSLSEIALNAPDVPVIHEYLNMHWRVA